LPLAGLGSNTPTSPLTNRARHVGDLSSLNEWGALLCTGCQHQPPPQVATVAALEYGPPWRQLITDLKFRERLDHAPWLGALLADAVRAHAAQTTTAQATTTQAAAMPVTLLTAVPLSAQRLGERGFNQAGWLARQVARELALPLDEALLLRWRSTGKQSALQRQERLGNLQGAFMPHPLARARLAGQHVAVVDDVLTTGATLRAAVLALQEGGAAAVSVWVLARTPSPQEKRAQREFSNSSSGGHHGDDQDSRHPGGGDNAAHVSHRLDSA
jgi:ComF family protein